MIHDAGQILEILDQGAHSCSLPMLDNGYVYLAATRMTLYRSQEDWALVMEVFGYSPRAGLPDVHVATFGSRLRHRKTPADYVNKKAYEMYLANNPNNESQFFHPLEDGEWLDKEDYQRVTDVGPVMLRGAAVPLPSPGAYREVGVELAEAQPCVHEFCRYLAACHRDLVLATEEERRTNVPDGMQLLLQLEEWNHPDLAAGPNLVICSVSYGDDEWPDTAPPDASGTLPSENETFRQLAEVLASGDASLYRPTLESNTHWRYWPAGGAL